MKAFVFATVLMLCMSSTAFGHATLDHADPKVGSTVVTSPKEIKVFFSEAIEPDFSSLEVDDESGKQVDKKDSHVDDADEKALIVTVPTLPAGKYKVIWKVVAKDTHRTHGDFAFTVKPKS